MSVSDRSGAASDAGGDTLPGHLPVSMPDLESVSEASRVCLVSHELQVGHVNRGTAELEGFKVETEVAAEGVQHSRPAEDDY